jgi:glucoamylase
VADTETTASAFGSWLADLDTAGMAPGAAIEFTLWWHEAERWEGTDFRVEVHAEEKLAAWRFARGGA